jgi:hypothetical protein
MSKNFKNQELVDRLLDQIAKEGVESLNDQERKFLDNPDDPLLIPSDMFFGAALKESIEELLPEREVHPEDAHDITKESMRQYGMRIFLQNKYGRKLSYTQTVVIHGGKVCTAIKFIDKNQKHIMTVYANGDKGTAELHLRVNVFNDFRMAFATEEENSKEYFIPFELWLEHTGIHVYLVKIISTVIL